MTDILRSGPLAEDAIISWLSEQRDGAYTPIGQHPYQVSAVFLIETAKGLAYASGANVQNLALRSGTCAEGGSTAAMVTAFGPDVKILKAWVMGAPKGVEVNTEPCVPCLECRQRFWQYTKDKDVPIVSVLADGTVAETNKVADLMPKAFGFNHVNDRAESQEQATATEQDFMSEADLAAARAHICRGPGRLSEDELHDWMASLESDAKVLGFHRATILRTADGHYVAGVTVENSGFPSSLSSTQAAAANMFGLFGPGAQAVEAYSLVQPVGAPPREAADSQLDRLTKPKSQKYRPLNSDELGVLVEAAKGHDMPLHYLHPDGGKHTVRLRHQTALICFDQPSLDIPRTRTQLV